MFSYAHDCSSLVLYIMEAHTTRNHVHNPNAGCGDWLKSCEDNCVKTATTLIPKHVHFISLNRPFSFYEWLAVVSAKKKIKPDKITVYTNGLQDSCWWRRALPYIEHQLIYALPGATVLNHAQIKHLAHKADFLRLTILYQNGGMYMDTDSLTLNSLDPLLHYQVVLAEQCLGPVAVGVILAQKHSCFICKFAHLSCSKYNGQWDTHSVDTLTSLVDTIDSEKDGVMVLPLTNGFYPMCWDAEGIDQLYNQDFDELTNYNRSDVYCVHLFNNKAKELFSETVDNFEWIQTSKSLVALAIRDALPPGFSEQHLDTSANCTPL